ncbi:ABC transporter permease subunit [Kitasatospora misakiensis]|uniref:ABC transporter permease subunit n=1 Tax=Kitasatospora misakiensis TaxID=67330 RepID=A0ABW0X8J1_9ACTN
MVRGAARALALAAVLAAVGLLPRLAGADPALAVLRARSAEQEATPEALAAVRADLGLDGGPLALLGRWAAGVARGEFGDSWVSGTPVLPSVLSGLGVSLALMGAALLVALLLAAALSGPVLVRAARGDAEPRTGGGRLGAMLVAVPEFLLATALLLVLGVWLRLLPTSGWRGPEYLVLPALALGVPAGALLGRLVADALPAVLGERWVGLWRASGTRPRLIGPALLRRVLPSLVPQFGLVAVGLVGGAVAVEAVFAVPGIGRTTLGAAKSQDLPLLQGALLAMLLLGLLAGALARLAARELTGPGLRDAALALPPPPRPVRSRRVTAAAALLAALLGAAVGWGLLRDPYTVDTGARLAPPSPRYPLGADGLGRDVLARLGHGAAATLGVALAVCLVSYLVALLLGFLPELTGGLVDVANALPPVIVGILVAAALGPGTAGASIAVALVSWPPLAAHAASLVQETRAAGHLTAQRAVGATPWWILTRHVLPAVAGPVARHAVLRLPGIALALASLGFLGLGAQPPAPEWGLLIDESRPYLERAPWAALAPAVALALLSALATTPAGLARPRGRRT